MATQKSRAVRWRQAPCLDRSEAENSRFDPDVRIGLRFYCAARKQRRLEEATPSPGCRGRASLRPAMPESDFVSRFLAARGTTLRNFAKSPKPLADLVLVATGERDLLVLFTQEVSADDEAFPARHRAAVASELAKPRGDELLLFEVTADDLVVARLDRDRIAREAGPSFVFDARNHLPMPWPARWRGPSAQGSQGIYRIDTPDCLVFARIDSEAWDYQNIDDEGNPRHLWRLELGITRAMHSALAGDDQIEAITSLFRHCGPWVEQTHLHARRHPSRRIFAAEVQAHPEGTVPWPEIQEPEELLGPPPGWEPVGSFSDRPLVFRIEGTKLHVEWTPPAGANFFEAATGRVREASRFTISASGRKPTDEEADTVFAMLGGAAFREVKGLKAPKGGAKVRVFLATAGWLRKAAGKG